MFMTSQVSLKYSLMETGPMSECSEHTHSLPIYFSALTSMSFLSTRGLLNMQFTIRNDHIFIIMNGDYMFTINVGHLYVYGSIWLHSVKRIYFWCIVYRFLAVSSASWYLQFGTFPPNWQVQFVLESSNQEQFPMTFIFFSVVYPSYPALSCDSS